MTSASTRRVACRSSAVCSAPVSATNSARIRRPASIASRPRFGEPDASSPGVLRVDLLPQPAALPEVSDRFGRGLLTEGPSERERVWQLVAAPAPPLGRDPATIFPGGPADQQADQQAGLLRLDPWRLSWYQAAGTAAGRRPTVWQPAPRHTAEEVAVS